MTLRRLRPDDLQNVALADLVADAAAIPAAAYSASRCATKHVVDLAAPVQRAAIRIPAATVSLLEAAEAHIATLSR